MDFINKLASGDNNNTDNQQRYGDQQNNSDGGHQSGGGGFMDGLKDKLNSAAGGGQEAEKKEDMLDKGIDFVQERFLGGGKQDYESAVEQAKDKMIAEYVRNGYKQATGSDIPFGDGKSN